MEKSWNYERKATVDAWCSRSIQPRIPLSSLGGLEEALKGHAQLQARLEKRNPNKPKFMTTLMGEIAGRLIEGYYLANRKTPQVLFPKGVVPEPGEEDGKESQSNIPTQDTYADVPT